MKLTFPIQGYSENVFWALKESERILLCAASLVGHKEVRPNSSPLIDWLLRICGLKPGNPWCAAFLSGCITMVKGSWLPKSGRASVYAWYSAAKTDHRLLMTPVRGRAFFWLDKKLIKGVWTWQGHIGLITKVHSDGVTFDTIEGNTGPAGGRDGDGVYRKTRSITQLSTHDRFGFIELG